LINIYVEFLEKIFFLFVRNTHVRYVSIKSTVSFVAYFRAKSIAEKLFTARRFINIPSIDNRRSINDFMLHMDIHINGVTSVNGC
jgi:hypothetical protein